MARVGIGSIMQETNTWSPVACELADFESQGVVTGDAVLTQFRGTNTEIGGAIAEVERLGHEPVPLVRAWASSSGRLTADALDGLVQLLKASLLDAGPLDAVVLSLHGAMAADGVDDADSALLHAARDVVGPDVPVAVCLDLHANVTTALVEDSLAVVGYMTYPHTDQAETGARTVRLVDAALAGAPVTTVLAKRPLLIPAEAQSSSTGPLGELRRRADALVGGDLLDISLFPVQPWLDVAELGFGVTVTTAGDPARAIEVAEALADEVWERRAEFTVDLVSPADALRMARQSSVRPFLLSESADSPTAGAAADSPAMIDELRVHGADLHAYLTVVDADAVAACTTAGEGAAVTVQVGASLDRRFHKPVTVTGVVHRVGETPVRLTGPVFTGMQVSMGRWAVLRTGRLSVLLTERPAFTVDPATFAHVGLNADAADVIVVRSATLFKAAYPRASADAAVVLDLPGASTPRLSALEFQHAPRPLYPIDAAVDGCKTPSPV